MRFRLRQNGAQKPNETEHVPARPAAESAVATQEPAPPASSLIASRMTAGHGPKSQATGSDVRAERLVRQVRNEVAELRQALEQVQPTPGDFTSLDLEAVANDPEAAAKLPPMLLVRALLEERDRNRQLERRLARRRERIEQLEDRIRDLKQERAWQRGRLQTLDDVIAALHGNLQDLRLQRDQQHQLEAPDRPELPSPGETTTPKTGPAPQP